MMVTQLFFAIAHDVSRQFSDDPCMFFAFSFVFRETESANFVREEIVTVRVLHI